MYINEAQKLLDGAIKKYITPNTLPKIFKDYQVYGFIEDLNKWVHYPSSNLYGIRYLQGFAHEIAELECLCIRIDKKFIEWNSKKWVTYVILHEIAHILTLDSGRIHSKKWFRQWKKIYEEHDKENKLDICKDWGNRRIFLNNSELINSYEMNVIQT